jgi:hypothetical protein
MFPDANDVPARRNEPARGVEIARLVALKLGSPVSRVGLGEVSMQRATVPEASIHEDGHARACEDDVGAATPEERSVHAEPKPASMKSGSQLNFGLRVAPADRFHPPSNCLR